MALNWSKYEPLVKQAVQHYWNTLEAQATKQQEGEADRGGRSAVTGGKQMDGFCLLIKEVMKDSGLPDADIFLHDKLELQLPGYFRPTKTWDMLIVAKSTLIAAVEFKSQRGPSFGNNFNNRCEEAIGTAKDLWTAYREGAFGQMTPRPWLGWVMLLEECKRSVQPVGVYEPHFKVFPEFKHTSFAQRYELMLRRLVKEKLYDNAAFLMATKEQGPKGEFREPALDLTMKIFIAGLVGHIGVHLASRG